MGICSKSAIGSLIQRFPILGESAPDIKFAYETLRETFLNKGKLLLCGNGGSSADCDHIVGELMKSFKITRKASIAKNNEEFDFMEKLEKALPAISLSSHTALVTAIANDIGAEYIFAQQVYGYGLKGDSLLAISTSGGASNVIRALQAARAIGLHTIGLTGRGTQRFKGLCDVCISIPLSETSEIQELCIPIYHAICADLEAFFFGGNID